MTDTRGSTGKQRKKTEGIYSDEKIKGGTDTMQTRATAGSRKITV